MAAARRVSRLAVGDLTLKPVEEIYDAKRIPLRAAVTSSSATICRLTRARASRFSIISGRRRVRLRCVFSGLPTGESKRDRSLSGAGHREGAALLPSGVTSPRENLKVESEGRGRGGGAGGGAVAPFRRCRPVDLRLDGARVKRFDVPGAPPKSDGWSSPGP